MLVLQKEDGTLPASEAEAARLVEDELDHMDVQMNRVDGAPLSRYERALVKTYLMLKLNKQIPNEIQG